MGGSLKIKGYNHLLLGTLYGHCFFWALVCSRLFIKLALLKRLILSLSSHKRRFFRVCLFTLNFLARLWRFRRRFRLLVRVHQLHMCFQISFLTKSFGAFFTLEGLDARVQANVIFDVARFVKCLTASVY